MQASSRDGRGRARPKIYEAGWGRVLNLQGGADTNFQKPVKKLYVTAEDSLICICLYAYDHNNDHDYEY